MNNYTLSNIKLPLNGKYDVIVIGGGPSGCAAAIASSRRGAKTLLIEASGALGGMGTSGLVPAWCPFSDKEKIIYRGIAEEVFNRTKAKMPHIKQTDLDWVPIDPEHLKSVYDDLMIENNVDVLFNSLVCDVVMKTVREIDAIIVANKTGLLAYKSKVYVDCTGDADVVARAGGLYEKGDPETGELQPATHCFILSNVDEYAYLTGGKLHSDNPKSAAHTIFNSKEYSLVKDTHMCNSLIGPRTVGFNAGHIWDVDNTDPISVSKALMTGRKLARQLCDGLQKYYPKAFGNAYLVATANLMGIRETRRIIGDYVLTVDDYNNRRSFPDEIARNSYYIDVHYSTRERKLFEQGLLDDRKRIAKYQKGESHGIPYRCLVPVNLDNIIVAGRSISCERMVQGSVRVMPVCLVTGQAAGTAASLAIETKNYNMHQVDIVKLRKNLIEDNAYFH